MLTFSDLPSTKPGECIPLEMLAETSTEKCAEELCSVMKMGEGELNTKCFTHMMPVSEFPTSCRVLLDRPHIDAVSLPKPMSPREMARELLEKFALEARFSSKPMQERSDPVRCFEIRRVILDGHPAALIIARWMFPFVE